MKARVKAGGPYFSVRSAGEIWVKSEWREVGAGIEDEVRSNYLLETDDEQTSPEPLTQLVIPQSKRGKPMKGGK
jgi:hypothetical protein